MILTNDDIDKLLLANPACTCGHTYIEHLSQPFVETDGQDHGHRSQGCRDTSSTCWAFNDGHAVHVGC